MGSANGCPFDFAGLAGDGLALFRGVILSHGLGAHLVKPDITELVICLLALEAHREIGRLVGGRADEHAVIVNFVGENHLLNDQRKVGELGFERQFRVWIQDVALLIIKILYIRIGILGRDGRLDSAGDQLKRAVGQRFLGIHRQRCDDHVFQAHRRAYGGRCSGISHKDILLAVISVIRPSECSS